MARQPASGAAQQPASRAKARRWRDNLPAARGNNPPAASALLILQTAVDAGLGACFFGLPADRIPVYREQFCVPDNFLPIGAVSIGYSNEPPRDLSKRRKPVEDLVHRGRWTP